MDSATLRTKFLEFFEKRGHVIVPSSSLLPDDPSVLLTTAGMQQFKKYFTGELNAKKDFLLPNGTPAKGTASIQKSFRTSDIDEVGDERHLTFFEMLGNFSFGEYFKEEAIQYAQNFIKEIGLQVEYVTVFDPEKVPEGDWRKNGVPFDEESYKIWKKIGIPEQKIHREGVDNFWGPTGAEGPCGPTTEIYIQGVEIWNIVFNQFYCDKSKKLSPLKIQGVDTGMGLERLAMVSQKKENIFETDLFTSLIPNGLPTIMNERVKRIMLDHGRAIVFLISDGIRPSNKEQGYILRRLIRRMMAHFHHTSLGSFADGDVLSMDFIDIENLLNQVVVNYKEFYHLDQEKILLVFREENSKFQKAINNGIRELRKIDVVDAKIAFKMFESYGLTFEVVKDFAGEKVKDLKREDFDKEFTKHQEISRAGRERKFGGHGLLLDTGELKAADEKELKIATRLHTATHLLQAALRKVLGENVHQAGSDISVERTRFDFTFDRKLTPEELEKVENLINEAIQKDLSMGFKLMPFKEAIESGALYSPKEKYPEVVKVYTAKDSKTNEVFSKELCGGPHVSQTVEIGGVKIIKEEAAGAGIRRIRAVLA